MTWDVKPDEAPALLLFNLDPDWTASERDDVTALSAQLDQAMASVGHPTTLLPVEDDNLAEVLQPFDPASCIVFNWCESYPGVPHSEPCVARDLQTLGFTFTGADASALELSQDKFRVKDLLRQLGIPTPGGRLYERVEANGWDRFPAIVKAAHEHASGGLTRDSVVMNHAELAERVSYILETMDQPALVEDFIDGREFHVSIWGNGTIEMLPPAEMDFSRLADIHDRLCSYDAKFVPDSSHYREIETLLPAPLAEDELKTLEEVSRAAYRAVGCRDYGRIDVRYRDGIFYVLDINPNADISADASMAAAAEEAGYTYGEFGSRILRLAAHRWPKLR